MISRLDTRQADFGACLKTLLAFDLGQDKAITRVVNGILEQVQTRGDEAVLEYTRQFDGLEVKEAAELELPRSCLDEALSALPAVERDALLQAEARIRRYHERQMASSWSYEEEDGTILGQQITSLDRVGLYVPGGKAAYPSSVLMNAVPARVAGVRELIMTVPTPQGVHNQLVLAAAAVAGVNRVFTVGGAQAIGALAYGTETIPKVDKIVGPGNAYVAAAKRLVFGRVGIDMVAGPSEILIICDGHTPPEWIAMDLFSQAEHDELAQAILLCPDAHYIDAVEAEMARLLPTMPRREVIASSLSGRGALIRVLDLDEACRLANTIAPEHLELSVAEPMVYARKIQHAGAIFLGRFTPEALGDYCAGPNHVLPTSGTARFSSPLGVYDFQKRTSLIQVSVNGSRQLAEIAGVLADGEGLFAHAASARLRLQQVSHDS
ncbi:MAG: histidinol dehydrogenase [Proteobacteria bacterium]|nr:histidinol dehydrogenase [Pseudomonadota bacterium]MDE3207686.1 histidinol dehydrogenase [Pseudomonadota bacterium]